MDKAALKKALTHWERARMYFHCEFLVDELVAGVQQSSSYHQVRKQGWATG